MNNFQAKSRLAPNSGVHGCGTVGDLRPASMLKSYMWISFNRDFRIAEKGSGCQIKKPAFKGKLAGLLWYCVLVVVSIMLVRQAAVILWVVDSATPDRLAYT